VRVRRLGIALLRVCPRASLCSLAVLHPSALHAEEAAPSQIAAVTVAAKDEDVEAFVNALREPLEALGLTVRASGAGDETPTLPEDTHETRVRVVVDARPLDHVDILVWVVPSVRTDPVQRRVPRGPSTPVVIEEVAYAVRATVASLLAERPLPVARAPAIAPPPPSPSPSRRPPPRYFGLDVVGFAGMRGIAASAPPAFGGGAALDLAFWGRHPVRPGLYLGASFYAPVESSTNEVTLETIMFSLRAIPSVELARIGPLHLAVGAGGGIDVFHSEPRPTQTSSSVTLGSDSTLSDPILEAQMLLRVAIGGASLFFGFDLDYDLKPDRYGIGRLGSGISSSVLTEWTVRPSGMLGVCLPVAGVSACRDAE
jgi:hypothetical protein